MPTNRSGSDYNRGFPFKSRDCQDTFVKTSFWFCTLKQLTRRTVMPFYLGIALYQKYCLCVKPEFTASPNRGSFLFRISPHTHTRVGNQPGVSLNERDLHSAASVAVSTEAAAHALLLSSLKNIIYTNITIIYIKCKFKKKKQCAIYINRKCKVNVLVSLLLLLYQSGEAAVYSISAHLPPH